MHVEDHELSPPELAMATGAFSVSRRGCGSSLAYYGMYALLVPVIGGGMISYVLRLAGVDERASGYGGIVLATLASLALFVGSRRIDRREQSERDLAIESLRTSGRARTYVTTVERAWEVTDFDHGPAYLLRVGPAIYIYLSSFSPHIEALGAVRNELTVRVAEPVGLVISASGAGDEVPVEPEKLEPQDISTPAGCPSDFAVFSADDLPASWRRVATTPAA
ncbi:MAG TPA: hypothetical protein VGQ36_10730 [Thermoanaerobaculia bacterium]|jgi:hypothetical protein|nr:hypothetical protein [Thermoanaerobaculia bacterium]